MKTRFPLAAALLLGIATTGLFALALGTPAFAQEKSKGQQPSRAAAKPLKAAEDAIHAKKYDVAEAKLKEVEALPEKSPYDDYLIHEMHAFLDFHAKNYAALEKDLEANLNSPFAKPADMPAHVRQLAALNLTLKDYNKAIDFGTRAVKGGFADDPTYEVLEQAYAGKGDKKATLRFVSDYVDSEIKSGRTPKERWLQALVNNCIAVNDTTCETHAFERLVSYYPKGDYWQNLLNSLFNSDDYKADAPRLQLFRLSLDVNVLKNPDDFTEMAQLDLDQGGSGASGEAVRVINKGFQGNIFTDQRSKDKNTRLLAAAKKRADSDQAAVPQMQTAAAADPSGNKDIAYAVALSGFEQYPQAVQAFTTGLKKGGVSNVPEARLMLGIAQLKAGSKDDAIKTFHSVKGAPAFERLASLWALHAAR